MYLHESVHWCQPSEANTSKNPKPQDSRQACQLGRQQLLLAVAVPVAVAQAVDVGALHEACHGVALLKLVAPDDFVHVGLGERQHEATEVLGEAHYLQPSFLLKERAPTAAQHGVVVC